MPWERQAILDAYLAGEKLESIRAEFGVSISYPSALARRAGHPVRPMARKAKQIPKPVLTVQPHSSAPR